VLTAVVLYALLRPLTGGSGDEGSRAAFNATVYRDQLGEVQSDRERGLIGEGDAEAARIEIARRLLAADEEGDDASGSPRRSPLRALAVGLAVLLPLAALSLYLIYGSPRLRDQPLVARLQDPASNKNLEVLVARVEARLREHPEEGEGWEVIAPVYMGWRRYADAAEAYRQSIRLLGESPKRLASYGQALVLANNGVVTEDAREALERALVLDPKLIEPRLVLIIAKEQDGQLAAAIADWRAMLASAPAEAPWRKLVEQRLAEDEAKLAGKAVPGAPEGGPAAVPRGPSPGDVAAAQTMSPADRQAMIESMVQGLAEQLDQKGDDLAGWLKLVRAYTVLDRKDDALKALEKAKTQFSGNESALRELDALAAELGLKS
ncbi:MAG TPA: c-type cytochrome biogenesis protein CcmI, partial [Methyloceanibacter sp.]|nr:c-type cytochrome biogenesis protein CcmI [Methyloceanibacter sp.]